MLSELDQLRFNEILEHAFAQDDAWFKANNIMCDKKGDYWILNYGKYGKCNEYSNLTRSVVINQAQKKLQSFPFVRFFNYGEAAAEVVDFANADLIEKLDGSFVAVSFQPRLVQTRVMLSTNDFDYELISFRGEKFKLMHEIEKYLPALRIDEEDSTKTWIFELIIPFTRVVTKYEPHQYGLYLIGVRDMNQPYLEFTEDELDFEAKKIGALRPRRWDISCYNDIMAMMAQFSSDYEGFVVRDRASGKRVKVKSKDYLKVHRCLDQDQLSYKNLLSVWLTGENNEVVAYLPEAKSRIDVVAKKFTQLINRVVAKVLVWQDLILTKKWDRRSFGMAITGVDGDVYAEPNGHIRRLIIAHYLTPENELHAAVEESLRKKSVYAIFDLMELKQGD